MKALLIIIVVSNGFGQKTETTVKEFSSMQACEAAAKAMPTVLRDGLGMPSAFVTAKCVVQ